MAGGAGDSGILPGRRGLWCGLGFAIFSCGLVTVYLPVWQSDLSQQVAGLAGDHPFAHVSSKRFNISPTAGDYSWTVWAVGRNARVLHSNPSQLFDAEPCYPEARVLALGHPLISPALLGVPVHMLTGDPILTYNFISVLILIIGAMAMFFVIWDWAGSPSAGIVAGLLYTFQIERLVDIDHFFLYDTGWTLIALFFARRLFAQGGKGNALVTGLCCSMLVGHNFYAFFSSVVLAVPLLIWLVRQYGLSNLRLPTLACALLPVALSGAFVFGPFLMTESESLIKYRLHLYVPWVDFAPWGRLSVGWIGTALAILAFLPMWRHAKGTGWPRPNWALLAGTAIIFLTATGSNICSRTPGALNQGAGGDGLDVCTVEADGSFDHALPNLFVLLSTVLPGLEVVRSPFLLFPASVLALSVLAGFGAAVLTSRGPKNLRPYLGLFLIGATYIELLHPSLIGLRLDPRYEPLQIAPSSESIQFFEELKAIGNHGPLFELPLVHRIYSRFLLDENIERVLRSAYHGRRTVACYNSFIPGSVDALVAVANRIPSRDALSELASLGFTTIVFHHRWDPEHSRDQARALKSWASAPNSGLERIHTGDGMTAYAITRSIVHGGN